MFFCFYNDFQCKINTIQITYLNKNIKTDTKHELFIINFFIIGNSILLQIINFNWPIKR